MLVTHNKMIILNMRRFVRISSYSYISLGANISVTHTLITFSVTYCVHSHEIIRESLMLQHETALIALGEITLHKTPTEESTLYVLLFLVRSICLCFRKVSFTQHFQKSILPHDTHL
jgi:hypothetical protein